MSKIVRYTSGKGTVKGGKATIPKGGKTSIKTSTKKGMTIGAFKKYWEWYDKQA